MTDSISNNSSSVNPVIDLITNTEKVKPPKMYHVVILNDDFTPMDFVIAVLIDVFHKSSEEAKRITLKIHYEKRGIAGTYTKEVAHEKSIHTKRVARASDFPLNCTIEAAD